MANGLAAVPPAQLPSRYADVVKIALRPRQSRAFVLSLLVWHVLLSSAQLKMLALVSPLTLLISVVSFAVGILPLLMRRKRVLASSQQYPPRLAASKAAQVSAIFSNANTWSTAYSHALGFVALALAYSVLLTVTAGGWGPQMWVESHGSYYLNERFLFLMVHAALLGVVYSIVFRTLPSGEIAALAPFDASINPAEPLTSLKQPVLTAARTRLGTAISTGFVAGTLSVVLYSMIRIRIWKTMLLVLGTRSMTRRVLIPSFRVEFGYTQVGLRSTLFSIASVGGVEAAYLLLDVYLCAGLPAVSKYSRHPNKLLLDGISDANLFFSSHAYSELARLSATDTEARIAIYRDVGIDGSTWSKIRDHCLQLVKNQSIFLAQKGVTPVTKPTSTTVATKQTAATVSSSQTVWDMLAAGGQISKPATTSTTTTTTAPSNPTTPTTPKQLMLNCAKTIWKILPADAKHVFFGPRRQQAWLGESVSSQAQSIAGRDAARVTWAVYTLKELLCHSLDEDPYGSVQKDIKPVLTDLAHLATRLREYGQELERKAIQMDSANRDPTTPSTTYFQTQLTTTWRTSGIEALEHALTHSLRAILHTFGRFGLPLGPELELVLSRTLA